MTVETKRSQKCGGKISWDENTSEILDVDKNVVLISKLGSYVFMEC